MKSLNSNITSARPLRFQPNPFSFQPKKKRKRSNSLPFLHSVSKSKINVSGERHAVTEIQYNTIIPLTDLETPKKSSSFVPDPQVKLDVDVESEIVAEQKSDMIVTCSILWIVYVQRAGMFVLYCVAPYYLLSNPTFGVDAADFSLIYAMNNIGRIVGSQILSVSLIFNTNLNFMKQNRFFGLLSQIIAGLVACFMICDDFVEFNYGLFVVASFLTGIINDITVAQCYLTDTKNGDTLMKYIAQTSLFTSVINQFAYPFIYEQFGFNILIIGYIILLCSALPVVFILNSRLNKTDTGDSAKKIKSFSRRKSITHAITEINQNSKISLSSAIYVLLIFTFIMNICFEMYSVVFPIVFADDFELSASKAGIFCSVATCVSFIFFTGNDILSKRFMKWQYPFEIITVMVCVMLTQAAYFIFYQPWIVYSLFLLPSIEILEGFEMIWRFLLCVGPIPDVFQKVTLISSFLMNIGLVTGSAIGPILFGLHSRLPFVVIFILFLVLFIIILVVYYQRKAFLVDLYGSNLVNSCYLSAENEFYFKSTKSDKEKLIKLLNK